MTSYTTSLDLTVGCLGAHLVRQGIGPGVYPAQTRAVSVPDRLSGTSPRLAGMENPAMSATERRNWLADHKYGPGEVDPNFTTTPADSPYPLWWVMAEPITQPTGVRLDGD